MEAESKKKKKEKGYIMTKGPSRTAWDGCACKKMPDDQHSLHCIAVVSDRVDHHANLNDNQTKDLEST